MSRPPKPPKFVSFLSPIPLMRLFREEETNAQIAEKLNLNIHTVSNYRNNKVAIRFSIADEIAVRLGLHPISIWGEEWLKVVEPKPRLRENRKALKE